MCLSKYISLYSIIITQNKNYIIYFTLFSLNFPMNLVAAGRKKRSRGPQYELGL